MKTKNKILSAMFLGLIVSTNTYANFTDDCFGKKQGNACLFAATTEAKDSRERLEIAEEGCRLDNYMSCKIASEEYLELYEKANKNLKSFELMGKVLDYEEKYCKLYLKQRIKKTNN